MRNTPGMESTVAAIEKQVETLAKNGKLTLAEAQKLRQGIDKSINFNKSAPDMRGAQEGLYRQRPVVMRYRQWADAARLQAPTTLPSEPLRLHIRAFFEMPKSWSKKLKAEQAGQPHRVKPDWDNIGKAVQDIFWQNDQMVAEGRVCKFWDDGKGARVEVEVF